MFIDWDLAAPAERLWDLAYAVHSLVPLTPVPVAGLEEVDRDRRPQVIATSYGLDDAGRLRSRLPRRTR